MSRILRRLVQSFPLGPFARQRRATRNPVRWQQALLRGLLKKAATTEWGIRNKIDDVLAAPDLIDAYQRQIPLAQYIDAEHDLQRMLRGENNILWPDQINYAAISGGTSSRGRYFPVSDAAIQKNLQCSLASVLAYLAVTGKFEVLRGKILTLSGGTQAHPDFPGKTVGEISGVMSHFNARKTGGKSPKWMAVPVEKQIGENWNEKLRSIAEASLDLDVRMIVCTASWGLVLFRYLIQHYNMVHGTSISTVGEIWPNLGLVVSGGVPLRTYRAALQEIIGLQSVDFQEVYGATQGFFAFQSDPRDPAMNLWLGGGIFYEFVRLEEFQQPNAKRWTLADVQPNVNYVMYVSTCSGLWSHCIEDIVRFDSVRPPKIFVVGRTAELLCTMGEAVTADEVQRSIEAACLATQASLSEFHLAPLPALKDRPSGHQLVVEFARAPECLDAFSEAYDAHLQANNPHFRKWRTQRGFGQTQVVAVPAGTFQRWLFETREDVRSQSKIPRLKDDRTIIDAILARSPASPQLVSTE